ncbi:hypothetical protein [Acidocella aquatica]|uniref:hypothetical protein n=1 Tax=Acidocella aquatica TaxID=1922313 RepID=UPI0024E05DE6|nr:hypothetical protein [Acidocella aquatica]
MNIKWLCVVFAAVCGVGAAQARQPPNPPPSGEVVHLFGPGSLATHFLPSGNGAAPAGASGENNYVEPSTSDILHQMFVTGDPNLKPGQAVSKGRNGGN